MEELEAETASSGGEAMGLLRINAPLTFGNLHLAPLWPRFIAANPKVSPDITLNDRVVDLVEEGYDIAIRIANRLDPPLVSRRDRKSVVKGKRGSVSVGLGGGRIIK